LSNVGRVAVKDCFKLLSFLHLYLLFYYNFLTVLIMRVHMLKGNTFYPRYHHIQQPGFLIKVVTLWRFDNMISGFLAYFHCACVERLFRSIRSKIWPCHSLRRRRFHQYTFSESFGDLFSAHAQKWQEFCFRSKICRHRSVQRPWFPI